MIFSTTHQFNCLFVFLFFGIILGIISIIFFGLFLKKFQKKFIIYTLDGVFYTFFSIFFVILLNIFNFGKFSISLILVYLIGYIWINKACKNLVVFLENKWYNIIKHESKHKS